MKIICISGNYPPDVAEAELHGGGGTPVEPVFFCKPDTALLRNNDPFYIPSFSREVHCGTGLVVRINRVAKSIEERFAGRCYDEVGLGIDFTAMDLRRRCMAGGLPWEICNSFDKSAAVSPRFIKLEELGGDTGNLMFGMELNGKRVQDGRTSGMIFGVDSIISYVSRFMTLKIGDLIFTGTPSGAVQVSQGDRVTSWLEDETLLDFDIK